MGGLLVQVGEVTGPTLRSRPVAEAGREYGFVESQLTAWPRGQHGPPEFDPLLPFHFVQAVLLIRLHFEPDPMAD